MEKKKNWHILWLAPTDAKGMHEAKIIHVSKKSTYHKTRYLFVTFTKTIYKFISYVGLAYKLRTPTPQRYSNENNLSC